MMPVTGRTVLHYEVGNRIGAGCMAEVYRARDTRLGHEVALKFISPEYRTDADRRARLLKEARAAAVLSAPAIATTYDIAETRFGRTPLGTTATRSSVGGHHPADGD